MLQNNILNKMVSYYLPLQPGFESKSQYYKKFWLMRDPNNNNIIIFYQFKSNLSGESTLIVPDGCVDVIFSCNPYNPYANFCGTVLQAKKVDFHSDYEYFGVRYSPEQGICLMKDLIEKEIPLQDIFSANSSLVEKIANARSFEERMTYFFNELINSSVIRLTDIPMLIKFSVKKIYYSKGNLDINQLAIDTGYSLRYLRKKFEDFIGLSPKLFSEIVRFQNSLNMIMDKDEYNLWDIISENGYYDQAHFINQFKKFSAFTPTKFKQTFVNLNDASYKLLAEFRNQWMND